MPFSPPESVDQLLQCMVRLDSVNSAISLRSRPEQPLADFLAQAAAAWGLHVTRLPWRFTASKQRELGGVPFESGDQLLITAAASVASGSAPWLLFDSHLDTVAIEGMTIAPFGGETQGDKLLGRGACDTKGTGAAALWALKEYAAAERPNNVALLFSVDEEISMTGIVSFIENDLPALAWRPRAVIVGEPTMLRPVIAHNGVTRWTVTTTGVAAHSAAPYLGKSAIRMMMKVMQAIEENYIARLETKHPLTGGAVCTINIIRGGSQVNILADKCEIQIDRRLAPGESVEAATAALRQVIDAARLADAEICVDLKVTRWSPPLPEQSSAAFLPIVQNVLRSMNLPAAPIGAPFATNGGDLAAAGLPTLVWGPGDPYPAHTKDEWVSLSAIRQGVQAYLKLMRSPWA